jgi:hypothetical protein
MAMNTKTHSAGPSNRKAEIGTVDGQGRTSRRAFVEVPTDWDTMTADEKTKVARGLAEQLVRQLKPPAI